MIYYRVALWEDQSATWRWKSSPLTSLDGVLGVLKLYRGVPREHMRVFLSTSPGQMEAMLRRENQRLLSTAIATDQLWDKHRVSWIEVRRLEIELGAGGDQDQPYTWGLASLGTASARLDEVAGQASTWGVRVVGSSSTPPEIGNVR